MVKMMVYIGKTDAKQCFVMKHHFRAPKFMKIGPSESENHFLLKEPVKTRSHMVKMMVYIRFYRKISRLIENYRKLSKIKKKLGDSRMMVGPIRVEHRVRRAFS